MKLSKRVMHHMISKKKCGNILHAMIVTVMFARYWRKQQNEKIHISQ